MTIYRRFNIGTLHPLYMPDDGCTHVLVLAPDKEVVAQFSGLFAKVNSGKFVSLMNLELEKI